MLPGMEDPDTNGLIGDLLRFGTIASVDLAAALAIVEAGDVTSPPLQWIEWAGAFRTFAPPSVGEQVLLLCPEGDIAAAVILRGLYTAANGAPAGDGNPCLTGPAGLSITLTPSGIQIAAPGGVSIEGDVSITGRLTATEDVTGGGISLKSHTHGGVQAGAASSGGPK